MKIIPAILPQSYRGITLGVEKVHDVLDTVQIDFVDGHVAHTRTWLFNNKDSEHFSAIEREDEGMPYWDTMNYEFDLMVKNPLEKMDMFIAMGPSKVIFHIGTFEQGVMLAYLEQLPQIVRETIAIGMAINLDTDPSAVAPYLEYIDTIQCMGIRDIGYQGRPFDEVVLEQIKKTRELYPEITISVDGGVTLENAQALRDAGADSLVVGSAIFRSPEPYATIKEFQSI
ncbi:hypothetical protein K2Q02_02775 [Patescibacteria group bacterium]|nr:hypothetical protein [Patescibacteria group bacterium]